MNIELTTKQFRRLLDMVYIGKWVLNSIRGGDRIPDFDELESYLFSLCKAHGMDALCEEVCGVSVPSRAFSDGGIHEAIMDYEDATFFEILAEELAHRDLYDSGAPLDPAELAARTDAYLAEFEKNGLSNLAVESDV